MDREKIEKLKLLNAMIEDYLDNMDIAEADECSKKKSKKKEKN